MNRHQQRELAMTCLYQYFLLKGDIKQIVLDNLDGKNEIDPFLYTITVDAVQYQDDYIAMLNEKLATSDWEFNRLGFVERAILLIAVCELDLETAQKPIIIDEAVNLTKKFCDDDTYKLVNGVLDQL
ncbi:MAG: transcription antitermination factor NusB [Erysipelotrichaceae bacterium]